MTEVSTTEPGGPPRIVRTARSLIGWMPAEQAERVQHGNRADLTISEEAVQRAKAARQTVAARGSGIDQNGVISPAPAALEEHINALRQHPAAAAYFAEGWQVALADLRRVCAVQPNVFVDHAVDRVRDVEPMDVRSIAAVSLPLPGPSELAAQFDANRSVWLFSAPNPNLRIMGHFSTQVQPGVAAFGFVVAISPSYLQVARFQGRFFLRDGNHRAVGFLERGIFVVPVFTRELGDLDSLGLPAGMLPQGAYLGERPPRLPDYLDDAVSIQVQLPAFQKMVVIQGLEVTPIG
jgi:hypothetical protein